MSEEKSKVEITLVDEDTFTQSETEEKCYSYSELSDERATLVANMESYQARIDEIDGLLSAFDTAKTEVAAKAAEEAAAEAEAEATEEEALPE